MDIPKIEDLNAASCRQVAISNKYPEFYNYLLNTYPKYPWTVKLALYYHGLTDVPTCAVCGGPVKFVNFRTGWRRTCSYKCQGKDPEVNKKRIQTCLEHYGVQYPSRSPEIKEKTKQTNLERYGIANGSWTELSQQKIKQTNLERYGVEHPMSSPEIRKKSIKTCLQKYNVTHTGRVKKGVTVFDLYPNLISIYPDNTWEITCHNKSCNKCKEKIFLTKPSIYYDRLKIGAEPCTTLNPVHSTVSSQELLIQTWLDEWGIKYELHNRNIISPQEIDIWIPDLNIGIECNGCYWHSDIEKPKNYHIKKFQKCQENGIQLIQIWEDWIVNNPDIVKSLISAKLGVCNKTIYARNCEVKEVDSKIATNFLNLNHIQGRCNSNYRIGLYFNGQLVSLMCFNKKSALSGPNKINKNEIELVRFCNIKNTRVIGGAGKLLKHYIRKFSPELITSYSANDISDGKLYKSLGFRQGNVQESYWYIEPKTKKRYHRTCFTRSSIAKKWPEYNIKDKSWSEATVMREKRYIKIYDSGTTKWILKKENF